MLKTLFKFGKTFNVPLMKVCTKVNKFLIKMSIGHAHVDEYSLIWTELSVQISLPNLKQDYFRLAWSYLPYDT